MPFPWHMTVHSPEAKQLRRSILDFYGILVVFTTLVVIPVAVCWFGHVYRYNLVKHNNNSDNNKKKKNGKGTSAAAVYSRLARGVYILHWWLSRPLFSTTAKKTSGGSGSRGRGSGGKRIIGIKRHRLGSRKSWLLGTLWTAFILFANISSTGDDYFHLTKRLGHTATALLPAQYLLSSRFILQQTSILTYQTHETLNQAHRWLGRTVYVLFTLHGVLYTNYFVTVNKLYRLLYWDVITGFLGLIIMNTIFITSLPRYRRVAYRVFLGVHQLLGVLILPVAWFHVPDTRRYLLIAGAVWVVERVGRYLVSREMGVRVTAVSRTALDLRGVAGWIVGGGGGYNQRHNRGVGISHGDYNGNNTGGGGGGGVVMRKGNGKPPVVPPGSHYYVYVPSMPRSRGNPFTLSSVDDETGEMKFLVRVRNGFTKELKDVAMATTTMTTAVDASLNMVIEGPYGIAGVFPGFGWFDAFLFVTGGIGITMTLSVLRELVVEIEDEDGEVEDDEDEGDGEREGEKMGVGAGGIDVKFLWAVGGVEDAAWPLAELLKAGPTRCRPEVDIYISESSKDFGDDDDDDDTDEEDRGEQEDYDERVSLELDDLVGEGDSQSLLPTTEPLSSSHHNRRNQSDSTMRNNNNNNNTTATATNNTLSKQEREKKMDKEIESLSYRYGRTQIAPRIQRGRPDLTRMTEEFCGERGKGKRIGVFVCGPEGMGRDVRRALEGCYRDSVIWVWDERFGTS
ncbi:Ferric reductase like transmembrane component [Orbilia blumenaviensis]|uniref:Ferric reductase like transmembrane component n=1 Tax=Orbilia blumenaviensis TaxID=1796055 RepID=A0AAV9VNT4_9PEZI